MRQPAGRWNESGAPTPPTVGSGWKDSSVRPARMLGNELHLTANWLTASIQTTPRPHWVCTHASILSADVGRSTFISAWCSPLPSVFHDRSTFRSKTLLADSTSVPPSSWISSFQSASTFSTLGRCWISLWHRESKTLFHICFDLNLRICTFVGMFLSVLKISLLTLHNLMWRLRKQDGRRFKLVFS